MKIKAKLFGPFLLLIFAGLSLLPCHSQSLVEAAEQGNDRLVESLVANHADINAHGVWGRTALHFAADRGDSALVEFLLKHKADVNALDENGFTPIIQARGADVIKLLLAYGANINARGGDNTLFSQTIENPKTVGVGVLQLLLTNGVDVTASETEGLFQLVLYSDDTNDMTLLVPYYLGSTNPYGRMFLQQSLEVAMDYDRPHMVSAILSGYMHLETNSIQVALKNGDYNSVHSFLTTQPDFINKKDALGLTPLHIAVFSKNVALAELLLSNQADPNVKDDTGNTPLLWATYFDSSKLVQTLLRHKANMDIQGNIELNTLGAGSDTPLDFAIQNGSTSIAAMLITNGANLGPHKYYADTPLHRATSKENVIVVELLLARGVNVNALSGASWTDKVSPLDIAVQGNSAQIVSLLIANKASLQTRAAEGGTLFHLWARNGNPAIADQLLAAGCNLNATNITGQSPLHIAASQNHIQAMHWLLEHNAKINTRDENGQTPLHEVVTSGNTNVIELLLDYKADVNLSDKNGKTPLALLEDFKINLYESYSGRSRRQIDFKAVENLLLEHGAKGPVLTPKPSQMPTVIF